MVSSSVTPTLFFILLLTALLTQLSLAAPLSVSSNLDFIAPSVPAILAAHNRVRAAHHAPPLTWNEDLALRATLWANRCIFQNTGGVLSSTPYGENIAAATGDFTTDAVVSLFTEDKRDYDPINPTYNHFTQVVWKKTTSLGCAVTVCDALFAPLPDPATLYVCLYDPPGNVVGHARNNVQM